jgi:hypothetical protein
MIVQGIIYFLKRVITARSSLSLQQISGERLQPLQMEQGQSRVGGA